MPSFDAVSKVNIQEVDNAVNQAKKEITTRYDFRGSKCEIEFDKASCINLLADDSKKLEAMTDILNAKMVKRGISLRSLDYQTAEASGGERLKQKIEIKQGITTEEAKKIIKIIKDQKLKKIQAQIQEDQVRVTGPKRDDLQAVISLLKSQVTDIDLQFVNFKD